MLLEKITIHGKMAQTLKERMAGHNSSLHIK